MAQVRGLGPRVGGLLALFCIHRVFPLPDCIDDVSSVERDVDLLAVGAVG